MNISAWKKTSLIEVPDHISTVLFVNGCNFSCGYCHVPFLLSNPKTFSEKEIFEFLEKRKDQIEFVVITGGEPTLQPDLKEFFEKVKELGYKTALETNGSNPQVIETLLKEKLVNRIMMDIKTNKENYAKFYNFEKIQKSINLILNSNINYEFRTTMVPEYITKENYSDLISLIPNAKEYYIQQFIPDNCKDQKFREMKPYTTKQLEEFCEIAKQKIPNAKLRSYL